MLRIRLLISCITSQRNWYWVPRSTRLAELQHHTLPVWRYEKRDVMVTLELCHVETLHYHSVLIIW